MESVLLRYTRGPGRMVSGNRRVKAWASCSNTFNYHHDGGGGGGGDGHHHG